MGALCEGEAWLGGGTFGAPGIVFNKAVMFVSTMLFVLFHQLLTSIQTGYFEQSEALLYLSVDC